MVAVILLSCVSVVLAWVIVFVCSQRLLFGQIILPQRPQHNSPFLGFVNYFEINCPENVRNHAQSYLLRVVALTNATELGDGYLLNVGTNTFHVRDRYVRRIRGVKDAKSRYEETCFFVPNQGMPSAEQIATALLCSGMTRRCSISGPLRTESASRRMAGFSRFGPGPLTML